MFESFNKIARYNRDIVVTEKIDGTNAQIFIDGDVFKVGSRNRWITPEDDNFGFARWAYEHKDELMGLGDGRHYGEWWGSGIQRRYDLDEKRFSLFNVFRWGEDRPACCHVVPVLFTGLLEDFDITKCMNDLQAHGSYAKEGFMQPEGIVIYHTQARVYFKKTFNNDHK